MKGFFIKSIAIILMVGSAYFMVSGDNIGDLFRGVLDNGKDRLNNIINTEDIFTDERPGVLSGLLGQSDNSTSTTNPNNIKKSNASQPYSSNANEKEEGQNKEKGEDDISFKQIIENFKNKFTNQKKELEDKNNIKNNKNLPEFSTICTPEIQRKCTPSNCINTKPTTSITLINSGKGVIHECVSGSCSSQQITRDTVDGLKVYQPAKPSGFLLAKESNPNNSKSAYVKITTNLTETSITYGYCAK